MKPLCAFYFVFLHQNARLGFSCVKHWRRHLSTKWGVHLLIHKLLWDPWIELGETFKESSSHCASSMLFFPIWMNVGISRYKTWNLSLVDQGGLSSNPQLNWNQWMKFDNFFIGSSLHEAKPLYGFFFFLFLFTFLGSHDAKWNLSLVVQGGLCFNTQLSWIHFDAHPILLLCLNSLITYEGFVYRFRGEKRRGYNKGSLAQFLLSWLNLFHTLSGILNKC